MRDFLLLTISFTCLLAAPVQAVNFTVNSTADAVDVNPGDSVCRTVNGVCTLRAAIQEANALPGTDAIILPAGAYDLTIPGRGENAAATGDLDITGGLTITGAGTTSTSIRGRGNDRVFDVLYPAKVTISNVDISGGFAGTGDDKSGGGIQNAGTLTLTDVNITFNEAQSGYGGGIINWREGILNMTRVNLRSNLAYVGGGLVNQGKAQLSKVTFVSNKARFGGGIQNEQGATLTLDEGAFTNNVAGGGSGGGLSMRGSVHLTRVTFSENGASNMGGGIYQDGITARLTLTNVTIHGNYAQTAQGGGIINVAGSMEVTNVTITGNTAPIVYGKGNGSGIWNHDKERPVKIKNTIVASNLGGDCAGKGIIFSLGHNLDSDDTCDFVQIYPGEATSGDHRRTDPKLGPLQDNGGFSKTRAPLPGSPAIDAGDNVGCPPTDQRGVARPQGAACDIGAYEFQGVPIFRPPSRPRN